MWGTHVSGSCYHGYGYYRAGFIMRWRHDDDESDSVATTWWYKHDIDYIRSKLWSTNMSIYNTTSRMANGMWDVFSNAGVDR